MTARAELSKVNLKLATLERIIRDCDAAVQRRRPNALEARALRRDAKKLILELRRERDVLRAQSARLELCG